MRKTRSVLVVLAILAPTGAGAQEVWDKPTYGTAYLKAGFQPDPHQVEMRAGGDIDVAPILGGECKGHIASSPDYSLTYGSGQHPFAIFVEGQADTTLVVRDPSGSWYCSDDFNGSNPAVVLDNPVPGPYQIWVGVYAADGGNPEVALLVTAPLEEEAPSGEGPDIEWGDNTSRFAGDGQCDDPRFAGPGTRHPLLARDRYHDADDCRRLFEEGRIYLR